MKKTTIGQLAKAVGGELLKGDPGTAVYGITTDSRDECAGCAFVPLVGEKFDGHDFVSAVSEKGATLVFWAREGMPDVHGATAVIKVADALKAYQAAAMDNRNRCKAVVIGLTGSSGKTTTKALISNMLSKRKTVATYKNENNEVGVPKTLLKINEDTEFAVVEMGMRARGEIAESASVALPDYGIITNVGVTHIEILGSELEIALAKGEILEFVKPGGKVFLNADNKWTEMLREKAGCEVVTFGMENGDVRSSGEKYGIENVEFDVFAGAAKLRVKAGAPGKAGVYNGLCAVALGLELGLSPDEISECLSLPIAEEGRMKKVAAKNGALVLDDSYNANPCSMRMALDLLSKVEWNGRKVAVLADMLELGEHSRDEHYRLGLESAGGCADVLVTMGAHASEIARGAAESGAIKKENIFSFATFEELENKKSELFRSGDLALVKGSRGLKTERVVKMIAEME